MRTLLLAIMIVLLPVRGWLGDAMAVEMVRHSLPAAAVAVSSSMSTAAAEVHCHEAMGADSSGMSMDMSAGIDMSSHDGSNNNTDHQGCGTCTACQVCHTVALGGLPLADTVNDAPRMQPLAHAARFVSAEPVSGLKPPIS